ncbi:MAG: MFS transporter [Coriobacteriales bacterium]|nr:MFS transporter [Coriobacteriales bacterium]
MARAGNIHYSWLVCSGCAIALFCTSGLSINAFTVYQPFLIDAYGLTGAESSAIITVRSLFAFIAMFLTAPYYKRISLRAGLTLATLLIAAGILLFGLARDFISCCFAAAVVGIAYGLGTMVPIAMLLGRWFEGGRNTALGICTAVTGLSTLGIPTLLTALVETWGLTFAFTAEAVFIVLCALACFVLVRSCPADMGLEPYGQGLLGDTTQTMSQADKKPLAKRAWYVLAPMLLLLGGLTSVGYSHLSVFTSSNGFASHVTALFITVSGVALILSKIAFGFLSEKISVYRCNWLFGCCLIAGFVLLCVAQSSIVLMFCGVCLYGIGLATTTVGLTAWAGDLSDTAHYDQTVRRFQIGYAAGGLVFSPLPGILADAFGGSYIPAYIFFAVCAVFVVLTIQAVYRFHTKGYVFTGAFLRSKKDSCVAFDKS